MNAIDTVVIEAARIRRVQVRDVLSKARTSNVVRVRHECMYLARTLTSASFAEIGLALGRDHATVIHGVGVIERRILDVVGYGDDLEAVAAAIEPSLSPLDLQPLARPTAAARLELLIEGRLKAIRNQFDTRTEDLTQRLAAVENRPSPPPMIIVGNRQQSLPTPVLRALARYEQDRFSARERFALNHLIETLKGTRSATRGDA